jgi:hypothetical protein
MRLQFLFSFTISLLTTIVFSTTAQASILLPGGLDGSDREAMLNIVGLGTSSKILSDPYPMGGYSGFEFGLAFTSLPTDELGRLGDGLTSPQQESSYPVLSIGKGLYEGIDLFIQFTPFNKENELSQYGGILRWSFYEADGFPVNLSILGNLNSANIGNRLTTRSYGADLIAGIDVDNVALYAGGGTAEATGTFAGSRSPGSGGITDSGLTETNRVSGTHTVVGANVHFLENFFVALQIDRYTAAVFSGKLGVRF